MLSVTGRSTRRRWSVDALSKAEALSELIAITPEEREEIKRRCEEKLCLTEFVTVSSDYGCDGCGAAVPEGSTMFGCRRCDEDFCVDCQFATHKTQLHHPKPNKASRAARILSPDHVSSSDFDRV
jgi:hypothetical protein